MKDQEERTQALPEAWRGKPLRTEAGFQIVSSLLCVQVALVLCIWDFCPPLGTGPCPQGWDFSLPLGLSLCFKCLPGDRFLIWPRRPVPLEYDPVHRPFAQG